jgi:hypothetical protein
MREITYKNIVVPSWPYHAIGGSSLTFMALVLASVHHALPVPYERGCEGLEFVLILRVHRIM